MGGTGGYGGGAGDISSTLPYTALSHGACPKGTSHNNCFWFNQMQHHPFLNCPVLRVSAHGRFQLLLQDWHLPHRLHTSNWGSASRCGGSGLGVTVSAPGLCSPGSSAEGAHNEGTEGRNL